MNTLDKLFEKALNLVTTWWPYHGNAQDQVSKLREEWKKAKDGEMKKQKSCPYCHKFNRDKFYTELKIAPTYFVQQLLGLKNFEIRKNDRDFKAGQLLKLKEYAEGAFTGRSLMVIITCITDYEQKDGYVVLGTKPVE